MSSQSSKAAKAAAAEKAAAAKSVEQAPDTEVAQTGEVSGSTPEASSSDRVEEPPAPKVEEVNTGSTPEINPPGAPPPVIEPIPNNVEPIEQPVEKEQPPETVPDAVTETIGDDIPDDIPDSQSEPDPIAEAVAENHEDAVPELPVLPKGWVGLSEQVVDDEKFVTGGLEITGAGVVLTVLSSIGSASVFIPGTRLVATSFTSEALELKIDAAIIRESNGECVSPCPWVRIEADSPNVTSLAREIEQFGVLLFAATVAGSTLVFIPNTRIKDVDGKSEITLY